MDINFEHFWEHLPGVLAVALIFGGWVLVALVGTVAKNWRRVRESEHLAALKQTLAEKGMSAEEIERVIRAAPAAADKDRA
jgi:hypothetical protein